MKIIALLGIFVLTVLATRNAWSEPAADVSETQDGDVYNFYFQKGEAPGAVQQGKTPEEQQEKRIEKEASFAPKSSFADFQAGLVMAPSGDSHGLMVGGQFYATSHLGLQVHLLAMSFEPEGARKSDLSADGIIDQNRRGQTIGGSVAAMFAPLSWDTSGGQVRFAFLGGATLLNEKITESTDSLGARGIHNEERITRHTPILAFAGIDATYYFKRNFGINGYGKLMSDPTYSQVGLNLAWRL